MKIDKQHVPLYIVSMVALWVYVIARAFYVFVFLLLASGAHMSPLVLPMQALWVLQTLLTVLSIWKPKMALIGGVLYFVLITMVWLKFEGVLSIWPYLYDRSLDIVLLLALGGVFRARVASRSDGQHAPGSE